MSIRMVAKELYRLHQEVMKLEKELEGAPAGVRETLRDRLRKTKAERDEVQRVLDGRKGTQE